MPSSSTIRRAAGALLLLTPALADAQSQSPGPAPAAAALLARCTSVPDAASCRAALRQRLTNRQRSLALTYLVEARGEPRDSLLAEAVQRDSTNALAQLRLGTAWAGRRDGLPHMAAAVRLRPDWTFVHRRMAESYRPYENGTALPGGPDSSVMLWRRAAEVEPDAAVVQAKLGAALHYAGRKAEAEATFRRAVALDPELPSAVGGLCQVLLEQKDVAGAQAPCHRAIRGWGPRDHGIALRSLTWLAREAKDYALALASAERGMVDDPTDYHQSDRTSILIAMGRADEAKRLLRAQLAAHPADWSATGDLARLLDAAAEQREARTLYRRMIAPACGESTVDCTTIGELAVVSLRLGMIDSAFRELHSALARQVDCPRTIQAFREAAAARRDSAVLLARLRRELDAVADSLDPRVERTTAARFFAASERWERAEPLFRAALDSALADERAKRPTPPSFSFRWLVGEMLVGQGRWCEAKRELEIVVAGIPEAVDWSDFVRAPLKRAREGCREAR